MNLPAASARRVEKHTGAAADIDESPGRLKQLDFIESNRAQKHVDIAVAEVVVVTVEPFGGRRGLREIAGVAVALLSLLGIHGPVARYQATLDATM